MQTELSFSSLFNQTINFTKNRLWQMLIVSVVLALLSVSITNYFIDPEAISQLSESMDQQYVLAFMGKMICVMLIISLVVIGVCSGTVYNLSISHRFNLNILLSRTLTNALKVFVFNMIYAVIMIFVAILLGLVLFIIRLILPSLGMALLAVMGMVISLFIMTTYNFFLGTIVEPSSKGFFEQLAESHRLALQHWKIGFPMIIINVLILVLIFIFAIMTQENSIIDILIASISNFVDIFTICFFYRLYLLVTNKDKAPADQNNEPNDLVL